MSFFTIGTQNYDKRGDKKRWESHMQDSCDSECGTLLQEEVLE